MILEAANSGRRLRPLRPQESRCQRHFCQLAKFKLEAPPLPRRLRGQGRRLGPGPGPQAGTCTGQIKSRPYRLQIRGPPRRSRSPELRLAGLSPTVQGPGTAVPVTVPRHARRLSLGAAGRVRARPNANRRAQAGDLSLTQNLKPRIESGSNG